MSIRIIVDSTGDLLPEIREQVTVVPLTVSFGEEHFLDGVTIDHRTFYEKLIESDVLPITSQATPAAFEKVYREVKAAGDTAVVITLSSCLSGTYQSATIALEGYEDCIFPVDSGTVAIGSGILTELALRLRGEGLTAAEIAERLKTERKNVRVIAMLDTLEYLHKGGRISKTVAIAGGLLSIKPVMHIKNGKIELLGKARGSKQGNNLLVKEIEAAGGVDFEKPILLGYTGLSDLMLQKYIADSASLWEAGTKELRTTQIGSVVGTHAGPGAVAAAFFKRT
ncbi:MAG: DegV family protein [Clostridia bacterium]|nr:DegV family protein [Clostridia bacterium]